MNYDPSYWGTHTRLVLKLQELGYRYRLYDRLPIFQLWVELVKKGKKNPKLRPVISPILEDLDYLKALRVEGLEPEVNGNRYVSGG